MTDRDPDRLSAGDLFWIALLLAVATLGACAAPLPPVPPERPAPAPASCAAACEHMAELGCPEAEPTPGGATCVEVCENAETSDYARLRPDCVSEITDCTQLDACVYGW